MVSVYFAPMEGLTDAVYRRTHYRLFGGVERYYTPFISPTQNLVLTNREKKNVLPEYNGDTPCVPQVLTRQPEHFLWAAELFAGLGYDEINLNAGCPSGTVTAKGKGAGMLKDPEALDRFLETVCARSPIPVSVKTRIGFDAPEEWTRLLDIYGKYPLKRLIVHPRTCRDRYRPGTIRAECWKATAERYAGESVYNGDLFAPDEAESLISGYHCLGGVMLGRGLVANPAMGRLLRGGKGPEREELVRMHDTLKREWSELYTPDIVFMKLRVVMKHMACCFDEAEKFEKQIRKSRNLQQLEEADRRLFETCPMKEVPRYVPDKE